MSKRQVGWYHVRTGVGPECAKWNGKHWIIAGSMHSYDDSDFVGIGDRIPTPDEPWQCVPKYEPTEAMLFKAEVEAKSKEVDMGSPWPTEHPDDGGGVAGAYYRGLLAAAPSPDES